MTLGWNILGILAWLILVLYLIFTFLIFFSIHTHTYTHTHMWQCICGGQRTTFRRQLSPSTLSMQALSYVL